MKLYIKTDNGEMIQVNEIATVDVIDSRKVYRPVMEFYLDDEVMKDRYVLHDGELRRIKT